MVKSNNLGLLVSDMQDLFLQYIDKDELERETENMGNIIDFARSFNIPIFVVLYGEKRGGVTEKIAEKLKGYGAVYVVAKNHDNAFIETDLEKMLHQAGVENLVMTGLHASACVKYTAVGAIQHGLHVITSPDLIADRPNVPGDESGEWYQKYALFKNNHVDLITTIRYMDLNVFFADRNIVLDPDDIDRAGW